MSSHTKENYLKTIYNLHLKQGQVNLKDISKALDVSAATANSMMQKLKKDGWATQEKYQPIQLTKEGQKAAALIIRKHRITEMFLSESMGISWEDVHHIAEQIEHVDSPLFFDRMDELLNYPKFDPHGSPIPNKNGEFVDRDSFLLNQAKLGAQLIVVGVDDSSKELLEYLNEVGIKLGTTIDLLKVNAFDNSIEAMIDGAHKLLFSSKVARSLKVIHNQESN